MAGFVPPTFRNTKRYAHSVSRNVGNFYELQDLCNGSRYSVDCLQLFNSRSFLQPLLKG